MGLRQILWHFFTSVVSRVTFPLVHVVSRVRFYLVHVVSRVRFTLMSSRNSDLFFFHVHRSYISPMFLKELEDTSVKEGQDIFLEAMIEAYPTIGVVW